MKVYNEDDLKNHSDLMHADLEMIVESLERIEESQRVMIDKMCEYILGLLVALFIIAVLVYKV